MTNSIILPKRIGITCKGRSEDLMVVRHLMAALEDQIAIVLDDTTAAKLQRDGIPVDEMDVDLLVCVGGDGTILRALHAVKSTTPVVGINTGAIGFLAEVQPEASVATLRRLLQGFEVGPRERLAVHVRGKVETMPYAMNEVVAITSRPGKLLHFALFVDDEELERLRADGVIFATPTGSTAYAMSAGGPIVDPGVNASIIVPIAPFKLSARPTVVDIESKIGFQLLEEKAAELVIDGQYYREIQKEECITVTRGEPAFFVKLGNKHFLKLRHKLRVEDERELKENKKVDIV